MQGFHAFRQFRAPAVLLSLLAASPATPSATAALVGRQLVASGLSRPGFVTHAPGDKSRLFIAEIGANSSTATGVIKIVDLTTPTPTLLPTPFLSISGLNGSGEGGLLGLAFHPNYTGAPGDKFYVYVTANDSISGTPFSSYIREYTVSANPNVANTTFTPIMTFPQPASNHNGGWIGFGPNDGYLYIMSGDGGGGNDQGTGHVEPSGNAQNITANLLGKALRIDVNGDDFPADATKNYRIPPTNPFAGEVTGLDEIWSYGLRNPFRAGFDRATGDLWIGDVGQDRREEINFQPASSPGGENYGWRLREGKIATPTGNPVVGGSPPTGNVEPIWDYKHGDAPDVTPGDSNFTGQTVIGGVPYRGPDPSLQGAYFFADTQTNRIWALRRPEGGGAPIVQHVTSLIPPNVGSPSQPVAISEDAVGNLYITYLIGSVYRIVTNELTPGDFNADARVDAEDLDRWIAGFGTTTGAGPGQGDADGDGDVDGDDLLAWQRNVGWSALNVGAPGVSIPEPAGAVLAAGAALLLAAGRRARR